MSRVGQTIGRLEIRGVLGRGGMGEVYVAWDHALERKVALKSIRPDQRADDEARGRFLREARILSQLDHPGICRLYELREHADGDFLVLELIEGQSLRRALREGLEPSARMFIAERVAEALAAAHAKGIAHRDLKPDNVMLTDGGAVKVLDFGLAHFVDHTASVDPTSVLAGSRAEDTAESVETTTDADESGWQPTVLMAQDDASGVGESPGGAPMFQTRAGTIMGTIAYMSPEQARGERVTVASDQFAFGLLLQELFTGQPAYPTDLATFELLVRASEGRTRAIRGVDPDLQQWIERLLAMAPEARPTAAETLDRLFWIGGKRRRWWRRFAVAAAFAVLIGLGVVYTLGLRHERATAVAAQREAEHMSEFLLDVFAMAQPDQARGREITARDLLDRGAARVDELADQPWQQARMMQTIGRAYRQIGAYDQARPLLMGALAIQRRVRGDDHVDIAPALDQLASLEHEVGDWDRAAEHFAHALDLRQRHLGGDHPHVATSLNNLAVVERSRGGDAVAESYLQQALTIYRERTDVDPVAIAGCWLNLGDLYRSRGDLDAAVKALTRAGAIQEERLGPDHPDLAATLNNLAMTRHQQGAAIEAEGLYRRSLELTRTILGEDHPQVVTASYNLAELSRQLGRFDQAEALYNDALALGRQVFGDGHFETARALVGLGDVHLARGRLDAAGTLYQQAVELRRAALGEEHPEVASTLVRHAALLRRVDPDAASRMARSAVDRLRSAYGEDHPEVVAARTGLADLMLDLDRAVEAASLLDTAMASARSWTDEHPGDRAGRARLAAARATFARLAMSQADAATADETWRAILDDYPPSHELVFVNDLHWQTLALGGLGRDDEAKASLERLQAMGWRHPDLDRLAASLPR